MSARIGSGGPNPAKWWGGGGWWIHDDSCQPEDTPRPDEPPSFENWPGGHLNRRMWKSSLRVRLQKLEGKSWRKWLMAAGAVAFSNAEAQVPNISIPARASRKAVWTPGRVRAGDAS